jgi:hypothetical protein
MAKTDPFVWLQSLRSRVTRIENFFARESEKVVFLVVLKTIVPHTSQGVKRKRASKKNEVTSPPSKRKKKVRSWSFEKYSKDHGT